MINFLEKTPFENMSLAELSSVCQSCQDCPLHQNRVKVVFGQGVQTAPILVIGDQPSVTDNVTGMPFSDEAGILLTKIFKAGQIDPQKDIYLTNVVKCIPSENSSPTLQEVNICKTYLIRQIQLIKPKIILLLGSIAQQTILQINDPITKTRGTWYKLPLPDQEMPLYIMPIFHPIYLLHHQNKTKGSPKWQTWSDIKEIKVALSLLKKL